HRCVLALGPVTSGLAGEDRRLYLGTATGEVYAIEPNCRKVWRFQTRDRIKSRPLLANNSVIVSSYDGHVYAFHVATGELEWRSPRLGRMSRSSPVTDGQLLYL